MSEPWKCSIIGTGIIRLPCFSGMPRSPLNWSWRTPAGWILSGLVGLVEALGPVVQGEALAERSAAARWRGPMSHKPCSVQATAPRPFCRRPLPSAAPSPLLRSSTPSLRPRSSAPARWSITTRCPSSAPHFFMYPNVCFTPYSMVHVRLLRSEARSTAPGPLTARPRGGGAGASRAASAGGPRAARLPAESAAAGSAGTAATRAGKRCRLGASLRPRRSPDRCRIWFAVCLQAPRPAFLRSRHGAGSRF